MADRSNHPSEYFLDVWADGTRFSAGIDPVVYGDRKSAVASCWAHQDRVARRALWEAADEYEARGATDPSAENPAVWLRYRADKLAPKKDSDGSNAGETKSPTRLILLILEPLTDQEREEVFGDLSAEYCRHCGCKQEQFSCRCWDDS